MSEDPQSTVCQLYSDDDLARSLAGNLASRKQKRLREHLQTCPSCRGRMHELTALRTLLRQSPCPPVPRDFALSAADVRRRRRTLWYPVLRSATTAAAGLVLLLLLGGLLQPGLWGSAGPAPRAVVVKPTPLFAPTPLPVAVAPVSTWRPRPTQAASAPSTALVPTVESQGISTGTGYPPPAETGPRIHATVSRPEVSAPAAATAPPSALWPAIHLGGLALLGVLAGLTWLAYRRERAFFG